MTKKKKATPLKNGRPKIVINTKMLTDLCRLPKHILSNTDVVYLMQNIHKDLSYSTVVRHIKEVYDCTFDEFRHKNQCRLKELIANKQIKKALDDENVTMLIWLGKQYLGQSDSNTNLGSASIKDNKLVIDLGAAQDDTKTQCENTSTQND